MRTLGPFLIFITWAGPQTPCSGEAPPPAEAPMFRMGNGEENWIVTEGAKMIGHAFAAPE